MSQEDSFRGRLSQAPSPLLVLAANQRHLKEMGRRESKIWNLFVQFLFLGLSFRRSQF